MSNCVRSQSAQLSQPDINAFPSLECSMQRIQCLIALLVFCVTSLATYGQSCAVMSLGRAASLNGFVPFPADNPWNQDISSAPVDPNSSAIINFIGANTPLHPD